MQITYDMIYTQCEAVALSVSLPFKVGNSVGPSPDVEKWIWFIIIPNGPAREGWNDLGADQGLLRALVHWTPGVGEDAALDVCDTIADYFKQGTRWHSSPPGETVEIYAPPSIGGLVEDGQSVYFPVSMRYRAFRG